MAYGDLKVRNLIWNTGSGDNTVVLSTLATQSYVTTNFAPKNAPTFTGTINGADLILSGNLTVSGTQTIINTNVLQVEDKHIEIGKVSTPSDTTADGGGIILKASSDRTFVWINSTDAWTSSEHIQVASGKTFIGDGSTLTALNASNLGSGTVPTARLGTGTASSSNYLRGDGSWQTIDLSSKANLSGATFTGNISLGDNNITNVGEISVDKVKPDNGTDWSVNMGTNKNIQFSGSIGEIGDVTGFQATNDAQSANTAFGIRATDIRFATGNAERFRVGSAGQLGIGGATYGSSGQVLTSGGSGAAPSWTSISAAPEVELTASGSISNNQAVMVQSNGTAKAVAASTAVANPPVANTLNQIWTTDTYQSEICFDSSIDRVVGLFRHQTNGYPWYVVGQPNANGSITWDTPTQLQSTNRTYGKIGSFGNGKVVVVNKPNWGDNEIIYVRIGTVNASNNTISWGSETNVGTGNEPTLEMIDSSYFIVTWRQANASNGMMMKVIQQTGTNGISQGSNQNAGWSDFHMGGNAAEATYNSSTNKCVWAWRSTSNTLRHLIGTVNTSNKTISWGTAGSDPDSGHPNGIDSVWVSDTQFITFFRSNTHSTGRYVVVTISGNNMTSISSPVTFLSSGTAGQPKSEWMSGQSRILLTYKDGSTSDRIRVQIGTFSSGSVTWGTSVLILGNTGQPEYYGMTLDDEGRAIFLTDDQTGGVSQYSTIVNLTTTSTDADKFIGFSTAAYPNGQTATIAVVGNTSTQSSLTAGLENITFKRMENAPAFNRICN